MSELERIGAIARVRVPGMRLGGKPGEWLWRRLRLGGWFAQRKAERAAETVPAAGGGAERGTDRAGSRDKATPSRQRGKGRGGPQRHRKKRR